MLNPIQLKKAISYPLSDQDIQYILSPNKTNIIQYPDLADIDDIDELFDNLGRCVVFIPITETFGHWCALIKKNGSIQWFDPYGVVPDGEKKWINKAVLKRLHEDKPLLKNLLQKSNLEKGYKILYNKHHWESETPDISTCGRWVAVVLLMYKYSFQQIDDLIKKSGDKPDVWVTNITYSILGK